MKALLLFFLTFNVYAKFTLLRKEPKKTPSKEVSRLKKENKKLKKLLKMRIDYPLIIDSSLLIRRGTYLAGETVFSILSTNIESPIQVTLFDNPYFPPGTQIHCEGLTKHKRIHAQCDAIVHHDFEHKFRGRVLNKDGSAGIAGLYYTGKEEYLAGIVASELAKGFLSIGYERKTTLLGDSVANTLNNQILQGGINTSNELTSVMKEQMMTKEPKVFVHRGTPVLIYFDETFTGEKK